jgi:hypothetical protein
MPAFRVGTNEAGVDEFLEGYEALSGRIRLPVIYTEMFCDGIERTRKRGVLYLWDIEVRESA